MSSRYSTSKSTSPSMAIEDSKKKASLLKDSSWIKKPDDEDEAVDRDPNFGKSVLGRYRSNESLTSSEPEQTRTSKTLSTSTSVSALTKRFSGSQDELKSSTLPTTRSSSRNTVTSRTSVTEEPKTSTTTTTITENGKTTETTITTTQSVRSLKSPSKTGTFTERVFSDVKSSTKGSPYSTYSPPKTTKVTETTVTTDKQAEDKLFDTLLPQSIKDDITPLDSKTTVSKTETVIVKSGSGDPEDKLYDTLIPKPLKDDLTDSKVYSTETVTVKSSPNGDGTKTTTTTRTSSTDDYSSDYKTPSTRTTSYSSYTDEIPSTRTSSYTISTTPSKVYSTETVTVKSSPDGDGAKTTTTTRTSSTTEDELYGTLLPKSITSNPSTPTSTSVKKIVTVESSRGSDSPTLTSSTRTTSYSSYTDEIPSTRTSSYTISTTPSYEYKSITSPTTYTSYRTSRSDDPDPYSKSSFKSTYASTERTVLEKDLCSCCRKPFTGDAKIVLDEMRINCHASCFKCEVCNGTLGHLKAGDSMWIYKHMVHCERCFDVTREKWRSF